MAESIKTEILTAVVSESTRAAEALVFARGYLRALADSTSSFSDLQLRELKHLIGEAVALAKDLGPRIKVIVEQSQEANEGMVRALLARISILKEQSRKLADIRDDMLRRNPEIEPAWSATDQTEIDDLGELFDEAEETLALGLSAGFREDVHAARSEAEPANDGGGREEH